MMVSDVHKVCKTGCYIAIISATVETENPEKELEVALKCLGTIKEKFITISDLLVPNTDFKDNVYITQCLDPMSHFESATEDVLRLYKLITGKDLDLVNRPEDAEDQ